MTTVHSEMLGHVRAMIALAEKQLADLRAIEIDLIVDTGNAAFLPNAAILPIPASKRRKQAAKLPNNRATKAYADKLDKIRAAAKTGNGTATNGVTMRAAITDVLAANGGLPLAELVKAVAKVKKLPSKASGAVSNALQAMKKDGAVKRDGEKWIAA